MFCPDQDPHPALAVLEGPQFRALVLHPDGSTNLDAFLALWPHLRVMARCTPADKYILVQVSCGKTFEAVGTVPGRLAIGLKGHGRVCQPQVQHMPTQ